MHNMKTLFNLSIILLAMALLPQTAFSYKVHAAAYESAFIKIDVKVGT